MRYQVMWCVAVMILGVACDGGEGSTSQDTSQNTGDTSQADATQNPMIVAIAAGEQHSLLLAADGTVYGTGNNSDGQLCFPESTGFSEIFVQLDALSGVEGLEASSVSSFFQLADNKASACGWNNDGRLGIDDASATPRVYEPRDIAVPAVQRIRAGGGHTLVLDLDDELTGFGSNTSGELGIGSTDSKVHTPVGLITLEDETVIAFDAALGGGYSAAVTEGGTVYTWGNNFQGQLGDGGAGTNAVNPLVLNTVSGVKDIAVGGGHTLALMEDGTVWAWGFNSYGQLGLGTTSTTETPTAVPGLSQIVAIDAGTRFSLALDADGTVWAWGSNGSGAVGQGTGSDPMFTSPVAVTALPQASAIVAGSFHALALTLDGRVWGWGLVDAAQLGTGIAEWQYDPIQVF